MAMKSDTKQTATVTALPTAADASESIQVETTTAALSASEKLKVAIGQLDAERTLLVKSTIENLQPGKPFDQAVVRDINKIETRKNRLIVARFATLLKKNEPGIQTIVHQLIEI
jgi:hypothetical protein